MDKEKAGEKERMSEKNGIRILSDEWLKKKQTEMQMSMTRAKAFMDSADDTDGMGKKNAFSWLVNVYQELYLTYDSLETLSNLNKHTISLVKLLLGIKSKAKIEEIIKRAEEFGECYELFMKKAKELEFEQTEKEKWK